MLLQQSHDPAIFKGLYWPSNYSQLQTSFSIVTHAQVQFKLAGCSKHEDFCVSKQFNHLISYSYLSQEEQLRTDNPDLTGDERRLLASLKAMLASETASDLEKAPLLRAINKAIDRLDTQVMSAWKLPSAKLSTCMAIYNLHEVIIGSVSIQVRLVHVFDCKSFRMHGWSYCAHIWLEVS